MLDFTNIYQIYFLHLFFLFCIKSFFFSKEDKGSLLKKFGLNKVKRPNGKLVWINGVSIGEAKSGITVAEEILKNNSNTTILFTTSTLTAFKVISGLKKILLSPTLQLI